MSEDPIGFAGGDMNLYRYISNSPVNSNDPFGLFQICTRPLDIPGGDALYSSDQSLYNHTYIKYRDGSTSSFGPKGEISESGSKSSCSKDIGSDAQERKMKDWAQKNYNNSYSLSNYNCKHFTVDVILNGN